MRGGTSKGVFFRAADLPGDTAERDRVLLRTIGSPDPYGKQIDGMGAATSSTSKIVIEFLEPGGMGAEGGESSAMFPTGNLRDRLDVPGLGAMEVTLITAGNPTVFVDAAAMGIEGTELAGAVDGNPELLARCESIRAHGAVAMGLAKSAEEASRSRLHTPKIAMVAAPRSYTASTGRRIDAGDMDLTIRMLSMGKLHHVITGTGAIATAVASAIDGTIANGVRRAGADPLRTRLGHPSGILAVGAEVAHDRGEWKVARAVMSRSARRLMEGWIRVPTMERKQT